MGDTSIIAENRNSQEIDNSQERNASQVDCNICHRKFRTQHLNTCRRKNVQDIIVANDQHENEEVQPPERFSWKDIPGSIFERDVNNIYEHVVYWRKNMFLLPTGNPSKSFINELCRLFNSWTENTPLKYIAMKAIHIMPALLLQKPSKTSKSKDHFKALERRMKLWEEGSINELFTECKTIQERLISGKNSMNIDKISGKFRDLMQKGNVNGALRLLTNNMSQGVLPLNDETLNLVKSKHPEEKESHQEVLLQGPANYIHPVVYDDIDESYVTKAMIRTKGGSGPSGLDAYGWRRMLLSNSYGQSSLDLRKAIANFVKKLCIDRITLNDKSLEAFVACRLIPLDKNPGVRPIGVGEILRRIAGKIVMQVVRNDVTKSVGALQVCAGQEAGAEAAIHAMHEIYGREETEAVLLIDAENAFNSLNRQVMLHNISIICPIITTFVWNCYCIPARLFVLGGKEIASREGTTQGDPTAMGVYAIGVTPLLQFLHEFIKLNEFQCKEVAFADDFTVAGKISNIKSYWNEIQRIGPKYGYFPKPSKSHLILKETFYQDAVEVFENSEVKITSEGERHLGADLGSEQFRKTYVEKLTDEWNEQLVVLSKIAESEPQAAYSAFVGGFKGKFTYFIRTIPKIRTFFSKIEETIKSKFIPAISGGQVCSDNDRLLISLPVRYGGLAIPILTDELTDVEYENSRKVTSTLSQLIINQNLEYKVNQNDIKKIKNEIKAARETRHQAKLNDIRNTLSEKQKRLNSINIQKGASNWLTTYPLIDSGFDLNKQQFWDAIRIRYGWQLSNLPASCGCGENLTFQHSMSCKKGGFVTIRHNDLRDLFANLLKEVCNDTEIEPKMLPLTGEVLNEVTATRGDESRLDIRARGFWSTGQQAFFDIRVFDPNAKRYLTSTIEKSYITNEKEKKRKYNERVLQVEHGTFTPLVFSLYGGSSREANTFVSKLSDLISVKRDTSKSCVTNWLRTKISFALLKSCLLCLRGSRSLRRNIINTNELICAASQLSKI